MYLKLDSDAAALLCCANCHGKLHCSRAGSRCTSCGLLFPIVDIPVTAAHSDPIRDFRIHYPTYCAPEGMKRWRTKNSAYQAYHKKWVERDSLQDYLDQIASVSEIYGDVFHVSGKVLDVGGHQGRLRHFLAQDTSLYVSVDAYPEVFRRLDHQPNLTKAYPCLLQACNFVAGQSEHLPFRSNSFDWIHMRSVLDLFSDPFLALLEAYRCCKPGGNLLMSLVMVDKIGSPVCQNGPVERSFVSRLGRRLTGGRLNRLWRSAGIRAPKRKTSSKSPYPRNEKMFHLTKEELFDLLARTGWNVAQEYWQKPPFEYCLYTRAVKNELDNTLTSDEVTTNKRVAEFG